MNPKISMLSFLLLAFFSCKTQQHTTSSAIAVNKPLAFPGAEGFGKYTTGGRGGEVRIVSNLNDDGEGSLRKAVSAGKPRLVVFTVSGTIHLKSKLNIKGDATIAGQTAPGDGICIADHPVTLTGNNIIIRYVRFRMGDRYQKSGMVDGSGSDDTFNAVGRKNVMIDHCSFGWSTDEVISLYKGDSVTLQWNIISEPLNYSYHFEAGDTDYQHHGYGGIWGGAHFSAHHNLIAHCSSRTPRFNGTRLGAETEMADFQNNVIYNWGGNNVYGGEGGNYNIVNNYYKYGPSTSKGVRYRIANPNKEEKLNIPFGKWYVDGNYVDGAQDVSANNRLGVIMGNKGSEEDKQQTLIRQPHSVVAVPAQKAEVAYQSVLESAGASFPVRDMLDERIITDVKNRKGAIIDVQGGYPAKTPYEKTASAWPTLITGTAPTDTDKDGMPDDWEMKKGLNPKDKTDASGFLLDKNYTNIEVYINELQP